MITIFAIPKPFKGHIDIIQRNAIQSWTRLQDCEVILYGDDEGTAEAARQYGVEHVPEVKRNEFGTPLLSDVFEKTQRIASNDILCYVNSDIILLDDFVPAVQRTVATKKQYLVVGRRWNIDITTPVSFGDTWVSEIRSLIHRQGKLYAIDGVDYFIFRKGSLGELPPFAVGRPGWDNWMIYNARSRHIPVINATDAITCVHQNHDYSHVKNVGDRATSGYSGPESIKNRAIAGGFDKMYTLNDADWIMSGGHLRRTYLLRLKRPIAGFVSRHILRRRHSQ